MSQKIRLLIFLFFMPSFQVFTQDCVRLSQDLLYAVKTDEPAQLYIDSIATISAEVLQKQLHTDAIKKAFWLNIYNAFVQLQLHKDTALYKNRRRFFSQKNISIVNQKLSLDDVEHQLLRHSKNKYLLGYFGTIFPSKFERMFRVNELDYRIHFALNCGAKSCPAIAFYASEEINDQLETATRSFVQNECTMDTSANILYVPALFKWFRADFKGKKGMYSILQTHGVLAEKSKPKIKFLPYDWSLELKQYKEQ